MMQIRRSRRREDGSVKLLHKRGPFMTEAVTFDRGRDRKLVCELEPTYLVIRMVGCRQRVRLDFAKLWMQGLRLQVEENRRRKAARKSVRRGALAV